MANNCCTDIWIRGDRECIDKIWNELETIKSSHYPHFIPERALLDHLGLDEQKNVCCRGTIDYMERSGDEEITLSQDDAWVPNLGAITMFCDELTPENVGITYLAIEPGCDIFMTDEAHYEGKWLLDVWELDGVPDCFEGLDYEFLSSNDLKSLLEKALGYKRKFSLKSLVKFALNRWCENMSINQIEYVEGCEFAG